MLEAENIFFSYQKGEPPVLKGVSLSVGPGERVGVLAPSGYGKTTLMKILAGYLQPDAGRVLVDGKPLPAKGYCPVQMVNPRLKLRKTLAEGDSIDRRLEEGLGIEEDWKGRFPQELSGGELQRFCIARALGRRTRYLIADEISTMLDLITQGQIWNFLMEETARRQIGMLVVSHSRELLDYVCTRQGELKGLQGTELLKTGRQEKTNGYTGNFNAV